MSGPPTQCSVTVDEDDVCEKSISSGQILFQTSFEIPSNQYMHCHWTVDTGSTLAVASDQTGGSITTTLFDVEEWNAFEKGECVWTGSDWTNCNKIGASVSGVSHLQAEWMQVDASELHSIVYNPNSSPVTIT